MNNMDIWGKVDKTDPAITKAVNSRGGFTAIAAQNQFKRATELFGPYGVGWGVKGLEWSFLPNPEKVQECALDAVFYYCYEGSRGEFEISSCMTYKPGNDTRKKLLTDLTTKALSKLGFNSDVFEGKFDDNKYIEERKQEVAAQKVDDPAALDKARKATHALLKEHKLIHDDLTSYGVGAFQKESTKDWTLAEWREAYSDVKAGKVKVDANADLPEELKDA